MKERIFNEYYKFRLAQMGVKLLGHRNNIYYGKNKEGTWFFYLVCEFSVIPLKECEDKLKALFVFNVLLNKNATNA